MKLGITTDMHLNPGETFGTNLKRFDRWIDCGDMLNIIPEGMKEWRTERGKLTVHSIATAHPDITIIWKNHGGRREWMQELFKDYPHVRIVDDYDIGSDDRIYMFRHGSEYTDWHLWQVGADDVTAWATRIPYVRDLWYKFCRWKGWMPSAYKCGVKKTTLEVLLKRPTSKYNKLIGAMWAMALADAHSKETPVTMYLGHTHTYAEISTEYDCKVINLANRQLIELEV